MVKDSNWDLDLRDGLRGESKIADLLSLDTVEVKTDRRWKDTGNLYIETSCYYTSTEDWRDSGLTVSKATHWAFVLEELVLIVPTHILREAVYEYGKDIKCEIPPNFSKGYLISPETISHYMKNRPMIVAQAIEDNLADTWSDPAEWEDPI